MAKSFLLGTDWWTDCDDVMAVRILARAHREGRAKLLGCILNACMEHSVVSLDAFLKSESVPGVPIGLDPEATDFGGNPPYQKRLAVLPSDRTGNEDAEHPVGLYRRILAEAAEPVDLIEIGYPQVLAALLQSGPDRFSPLDGVSLVRRKAGELWIMAGKWDEPDGGRENNFARNRRASEAAALLCRLWPGRITFLGWEVGATIVAGGFLPESDVLKQAMIDHGSGGGRSSWDPMLILLALAGSPEAAGYGSVRGRASADPQTGANFFEKQPEGPHRFVVKRHPDEFYAEQVNGALRPQS